MPPLALNDVGIDLPFNGFGAQNGDVGRGPDGSPFACPFRFPAITGLNGCPSVIPIGPGGTIPPNARVMFVTTGGAFTLVFRSLDFSGICDGGEPVYIIQNSCERSVSALANSPGASGNGVRTTTTICPNERFDLTYDAALLPSRPGAYYDLTRMEYGFTGDCSPPRLPTPTICLPDTSASVVTLLAGEFFFDAATGAMLDEANPRDTVTLLASDGCDSVLVFQLEIITVVDSMGMDTTGVDSMMMDTTGRDTTVVDMGEMDDMDGDTTFADFPDRFFMPSAFSPNLDGVNDTYRVGLPENWPYPIVLSVYNRWGSLVYRGAEPWDGRTSGRDAPSGTYLAVATYLTANGTSKVRASDVVLIR